MIDSLYEVSGYDGSQHRLTELQRRRSLFSTQILNHKLYNSKQYWKVGYALTDELQRPLALQKERVGSSSVVAAHFKERVCHMSSLELW